MNEKEVREHVLKLRYFYEHVFFYLGVNAIFIVLWFFFGGATFWPIYSIIGWGIGLGAHAFSLGLIPQMTTMVPFMTAEWEDEEVRRMMEEKKNGSSDSEAKPAPKKAPAKKVPAKATTRKTPSKKK